MGLVVDKMAADCKALVVGDDDDVDDGSGDDMS